MPGKKEKGTLLAAARAPKAAIIASSREEACFCSKAINNKAKIKKATPRPSNPSFALQLPGY